MYVPGGTDERAEVQLARSVHVRSATQQLRDAVEVPPLDLHEQPPVGSRGTRHGHTRVVITRGTNMQQLQ